MDEKKYYYGKDKYFIENSKYYYGYDDMTGEEMNEMINDELGGLAFKVKTLRKEKKLSQRDLAAKSNISLSTIIKIENEAHPNITFNQIMRLSFALKVPISHLIEIDFYVENMEAINKLLVYFPLMSQWDILSVFGAVTFLGNASDVDYFEKRLNGVYEKFPEKIKAFVDLRILSLCSLSATIELSKHVIPEPYDKYFTFEEYSEMEKNYKQLYIIKSQQCIANDPVRFLETGKEGLVIV